MIAVSVGAADAAGGRLTPQTPRLVIPPEVVGVGMQPEQVRQLEQALHASAEELTARRSPADPSDGGEREDPLWERGLVRLSVAAAACVPGAAYAGMTMRSPRGGLESRAISHDAVAELDRAQAALGEGPCVDALTPGGAAVVQVDDFAVESRWPRFAPVAVEAGIGSLLSYALAPHGTAPGAMNFYGTTVRAFRDPAARMVAGAFAMQAAVAVYGADRVANLEVALNSRDVIGQAKGILMERFGLDDLQAFDLLVRSSQDTNVKLVEAARWLAQDTAARASRPGERAPARLAESGEPGEHL